jgi:HK97 family phage major capsid protein
MDQTIKDVLDAQARAWEEFKATNNERLAQSVRGVVDPLVTEKLERLNAALDAHKATVESLVNAGLVRIAERAGARTLVGGPTETPVQAEYRAKFDAYLRRREVAGLAELEQRAMSVSSDVDGGFTVPADMSGRIVARIWELSPVRQAVTPVTISSDRLMGGRDIDEVAGGWVGEVDTRSETDHAEVGQYTIEVNEMHASPSTYQRLLDDSAWNIEQWLTQKVGDKFGRLEGTAFVVGTGIKSPRGFASYATAATADTSRAWGQFEHVASGANGAFTADPGGVNKVLDLIHTLNPAYLRKAAFWANRTTIGKLRQLADGDGKHVFVPSFQAAVPDTFVGYPMIACPDLVSYTTTGALAIAFGDMAEAYTIVDHRVGQRVLRDPYSTKGKVIFYTTKRVGGDVVNFNALKFLKFSA